VLEPLAQKHATKPAALLERKDIKEWRNARSETPGTTPGQRTKNDSRLQPFTGWNGTETELRVPNAPLVGVPNKHQWIDTPMKSRHRKLTSC
jgi:hypothetical protein